VSKEEWSQHIPTLKFQPFPPKSLSANPESCGLPSKLLITSIKANNFVTHGSPGFENLVWFSSS
jgi:hypothetical protein